MSPDLKDLKQAAVAKKYWAARESALKKQLVQDYLFRAQGQLRSNGKEHGTATFDLGDSLKVKFVLGKDRKVNADDVARVLRNRPDLASIFRSATPCSPRKKTSRRWTRTPAPCCSNAPPPPTNDPRSKSLASRTKTTQKEKMHDRHEDQRRR